MSLRVSVIGAILAVGLMAGLASPAAAQRRLTIAIMPSQYFSADAESAANLTRGLAQQFEQRGYSVIPLDRARQTFESMGLSLRQHYPDSTALRFGRALNADLVAYPRLLVLGLPAAAPGGMQRDGLFQPTAVVHLRVLNVHTGAPIYFRQIGHEYTTDVATAAGEFVLPQPIATAAAGEVTSVYFERVAGSRQEFRGTR